MGMEPDEYDELRELLTTWRKRRDDSQKGKETGVREVQRGYYLGLDWAIDSMEEWLGQRTYRIE